MASELPPTDYFTGISFNPDFYQSTSSDYLTASTGKSYFLSYPTAQGTETITTLKSSSIDSSSTTTNMAIASAQTSGALNIASLPSRTGNINIGYSTSAPSGLGYNINMGNILSNTSIGGKFIELAAASSGITISTSGTLDMIATAYNMGTSLVNATNINIGTTGISTTTINGSLIASSLILANGGLTVPSGQTLTNNGSFTNTGAVTGAGLIVSGANNITLGTGTTAPIIGQLGYIQSVAYPTPTISTTNLVKTISSITLATGTWIITAGVSFGSTQGLTKGYLMIGNASKTNIAEVSNDSLYGCTTFMGITTNGIVTPNLTSYVSHTTSTIYYLNILATYTGSVTLQPDYWKFYAIRIA